MPPPICWRGAGLAADTVVIESDSTYEHAATLAGAGRVRRLMSTLVSADRVTCFWSMQRVFSSVGTDQVARACHSPNDAWIDLQAVMLAFRHKAEQPGVQYIQEPVSGLGCSAKRMNSVILESGSKVRADHFVNTAGAWVGVRVSRSNRVLYAISTEGILRTILSAPCGRCWRTWC